MKAVRVFGAHDVRLVTLPEPEPDVNEVRIRVEAIGICGTDVEIVGGNMAYYTSGLAHFPITIGHEWTGIVDRCGEAVTDLAEGMRVVGEVSIGCRTCAICLSGSYHRCLNRSETGVMNRDGGMADYVVIPRWAVHPVPDHVPVAAAALVEPTAIAFNAVRLGGVGLGRRTFIVGDGPIGLLILQVARAMGDTAPVVCGADTQRLSTARSLGAGAIVDAREPGHREAVLAAFGGDKPEIILEASGSAAGVETALAVAAPGATIILQGLLGALPSKAIDLDHVVVNDITLRGALGSPGIWPQVVDLIASGQVHPEAIVTHTLPMTDFSAGFDLVRSREAIKVILRPNHG